MCVDESERKWRKNIQVEGLQGINFSRDVVVGGEEKASRAYLEDTRSANNRPWTFCAPDRWCSNKGVASPAYIKRESVTWCYGGRDLERELCVNWEIKLYKVNRNYREFVERLGIERVDNYSEYVPCIEADIEAVDDVIS